MDLPPHPQAVPVDTPPHLAERGWRLWKVDETGSTNTDLAAAAANGAPDRTVLRTDHQTAGRGRLDRRWDAPPGTNLLVSILHRQVPDPPVALTHRTGLALVRAVAATTGADARLKWPNDLLLVGDDGEARKAAGMLAQACPDGSVIVGCGINIGWAPDGAARLGDAVTPTAVLEALLTEFDRLGDDTEAEAAYRDNLDTIGRAVRVDTPTGAIEGRATGVAPDGSLEVLDACAVTHRIGVGDVIHLRPT
ncbi:MAG: biotin--[acetyl-CoA-carboxylase] ligase [Ilumatobacteraceae bacterium]